MNPKPRMSGAQYTSVQGVLDSIIRNYLLNELPPENGENNGNTRHNIAERDFGLSQLAAQLQAQLEAEGGNNNRHNNEQTLLNNQSQMRQASGSTNNQNNGEEMDVDQEYIRALHQCFEKRGVFRELQTFLRHKLVSILQDEWPNLQQPALESEPNVIVFRLVEDFLRCHKLLYTFSVLASESNVKQQCTKVKYGKLTAKEAEDLLDDMGIKRNTRLSGQILKCYFDMEHFSLLEAMQYLGIWLDAPMDNLESESPLHGSQENRQREGFMSITKVGHEDQRSLPGQSSRAQQVLRENRESFEQRMADLERRMEQEKDAKIKESVEKYKYEEGLRIRQEVETQYKLQLADAQREHFEDLQKRLDEAHADFHRERQAWAEVKVRQESELRDLRKQANDMVRDMAAAQAKLSHAPIRAAPSSEEYMGNQGSKNSQTQTNGQVQDNASVEGRCSCKCKKHSSSSTVAADDDEASKLLFLRRNVSSLESIQQDKVAFLQYRLERQEEEIKALQRQLLLSPPQRLPQANVPKSPHIPADTVDHSAINPKKDGDDIDAFLTESKLRVERLDTAASKVDELMHQLFVNKRRAVGTPLSSEVSLKLASSSTHARERNVSGGHQTVPLSPVVNPSGSGILPHQLPERHTTFISSVIRNLPSFNLDIFATGVSQRRPPSRRLIEHEPIIEVNERPSTPVHRLFPVAYGGNGDGNKPGAPDDPKTEQLEVVEPEESLFHMAMRERPVQELRKASTGSVNLKEKAMRNGALTKEKVSSSDESDASEHSLSKQVSFSESLKLLKTNAAGSPIAFTENREKSQSSPLEDHENERLQQQRLRNSASFPQTTTVPLTIKANSSEGTISSVYPKPGPVLDSLSPPPGNSGDAVGNEGDISSHSLSISGHKSEADEDNSNNNNHDDFWQL